MKALSNVIDIRGCSSDKIILLLNDYSEELQRKGCLWLINDLEPIECYSYFIENNYHYQIFAIAENEYRIFISIA
ncbi:hypothetical protein EMN47_16455 [Prolixibacteraceae bacterium JC049]|nr:hypothetical protein [Prolixibacteraceae bacterium JC049]